MDKKERIRFLYDQTSGHYDLRYSPIQERKYAAFRDVLLGSDTPLVLDVGGGTGLLAHYLDVPLVVLDLSLGMLRVARENHPDLNLIAADAENIPVRSSSFELVVSFSALQNLPNRQRGVSELVRVSSRTGVVTALGKTMSTEELLDAFAPHPVSVTEVEIELEDIGVVFTHSSSSSSSSGS